ncbi:MAG: bifunctional DNA-formamidopyrimidine glycosylase/DNA-(apurinic or apyrimidinic site) lyase [Pseudomonadota bacterium]|nr:bifunctional DNA-formamidopyrimidine glycosylase/DNA-(apurinic or apyrimidinic site) lyase [Pseudomonadota bacterium]MDE3038658.1 bifunctional DNA-formamidopyrimidine glycosylase/DNA-(apurinic or apyrimidinic site) lyase [Pseudomonadota bacterium]
MPELPEVETVRRGLDAALENAVIESVMLRRKDLRAPFPDGFARALAGRKILRVKRRAKYLVFNLDSDDAIIAHLGMSGRFLIARHPVGCEAAARSEGKHDHVVFTFKDGRALIFNDPRRFGLMTVAKKSALAAHKLFAGTGPEPLRKGFSPEYLKAALAKRKGPVKTALMDQALVAGVGNIYASEALFLAGVDPRKPSHKAADHAAKIAGAVRQVLKEAIASGGSSLRDFRHVSGEEGFFQHRFRVYGREGKSCPVCHQRIFLIRQGGRSTFFCKTCQK